jgi:hypothetical protein
VSNRPEAALERAVLARVGALQRAELPSLTIFRNEVGSGHTGNVGPILARELCPHCRATAARILSTNRITYGLGVGSPDLVGAVGGRAFGLELKSPTGRPRPEQLAWHEAARHRGVHVAIVRTVEEAEEAIRHAAKP